MPVSARSVATARVVGVHEHVPVSHSREWQLAATHTSSDSSRQRFFAFSSASHCENHGRQTACESRQGESVHAEACARTQRVAHTSWNSAYRLASSCVSAQRRLVGQWQRAQGDLLKLATCE